MITKIMELSPGVFPDRRRTPSPLLRNRRKLSIPTLSSSGSDHVALRRRFSNVGDAARKLSTTIGWRTTVGQAPSEEIMVVGRALCSLYIRSRLKRAGVFNRKLGLTRVRSAVGSLETCEAIVRDVFPGLAAACTELERMHPNLFIKIPRQTGMTPGGNISGLLLAVGHHLFRSEPSWGKVVAVYSVAGGLAVDSVRAGQAENLHVILEDMTEFLEEKMAAWVAANGGWAGLSAHCYLQNQEIPIKEYLPVVGLVVGVLLVAYFLVKFCSKLGI